VIIIKCDDNQMEEPRDLYPPFIHPSDIDARLREFRVVHVRRRHHNLPSTSTLPPAPMPLQSYVPCSCESFKCKYNSDGSGQKLQTAQTATRHQRADKLLGPSRTSEADALGQA